MKRHLLPIIFLIIVGFIGYHTWLTNLYPITHGDWLIGFTENSLEGFNFPSIWYTNSGLGNFNIGIFFGALNIVAGFLTRLGLNIHFITRLLFLFPIAVLTSVNMYLLAYYLFKKRLAALTSAVVYSFSLYSITLSSGHLTIRMTVVIMPLVLLFYFLAVDKKSYFYAVLASFFLFLVSIFEVRLYYIGFWMIFLYLLYFLISNFKKNSLKILFTSIFVTILTLIIPALLNMYGFLPLFRSNPFQSEGGSSLLPTQLFGAWYIKIYKILAQFQFDWTGGIPNPWKAHPVMGRFFLLPLFMIIGFLSSLKNRRVIFFGLILVVGIFLAKLTIPPFPNTYPWLFKNFPGFFLFREAGKFGLYINFGYSVFIGSFINFLHHKIKKLPYFLISFSIIFIYLWNMKSIVNGDHGGLFKPKALPEDYVKVKNFIINQPEFFRTFWVPQSSRWSFSLMNYPILTLRNFMPPFGNYINTNNGLRSKRSQIFLNQTSVKYVIVPLEDVKNDDNFFESTDQRNKYVNILDKSLYLNKVDIGTKEIVVYKNNGNRPHIYLTDRLETLKNNTPYYVVEFQTKNPTFYSVNLNRLTNPIYLNFTDSYHPEWKIRVGGINWFTALSSKNYFLPDKLHLKNEAGLNTFYLNPSAICHDFYCQKNSDGSYNIKLSLYYRPQSYVYLGSIVSLITMVGILIYILIVLFKAIIKNKNWLTKKKFFSIIV